MSQPGRLVSGQPFSTPTSTRPAAARLAILTIAILLLAPGCLSSGKSSTSVPSSTAGTQPDVTAVATAFAAATATAAGSTPAQTGTAGSTTTTGAPSTTPVTAADLAKVNIDLEPVFIDLDQPLFLTNAGDGSGDIFIVQKGGKILVAHDGKLQAQPFLDITARVDSSGSEQGLLGLAFDPSYKSNGYLYVDYIDRSGNTVIARFTAAADRKSADPNSFKKILGIDQPYSNHNGGEIIFGPDGMLWIGSGDGGSEGDPHNNGQNTQTMLGKILRIDVDHGDPYAIPKDNPFANGQGGKPEIWAYGLRNPWRFSFDRVTHDLYIGDVGQNTWEEINFVPASLKPGLNFGWRRMEGTHCYNPSHDCDQSGLTLPVTEYSHAGGNCSVTGGYVYRGAKYPSIEGVYFFSDYCGGTIWALTHEANGSWTRTEVATGTSGVSSFGEDENGEIYVCDLNNGVVYHLAAVAK